MTADFVEDPSVTVALSDVQDARPAGNSWGECTHCWHRFMGWYHMVLPDGHVLQKCCKCPKTRSVHFAHIRSYD